MGVLATVTIPCLRQHNGNGVLLLLATGLYCSAPLLPEKARLILPTNSNSVTNECNCK